MASLHAAAMFGNLNRVTELLNSGTNVNTRTALMIAAAYGRLAIVRELLNRGANINAKNRFGKTPLYYAAYQGRLPVVRELLKRGASIPNGVLNRNNIHENVKNVIRKHKAHKTILKYKNAATLRRRLAFIGSNMAKSLPQNMVRKILTARKNK